jgi:hypothetical protein
MKRFSPSDENPRVRPLKMSLVKFRFGVCLIKKSSDYMPPIAVFEDYDLRNARKLTNSLQYLSIYSSLAFTTDISP